MANFVDAVKAMHEKMNNASLGNNNSGPTLPSVSPDQVNAAILNSQKQMLFLLRTNPTAYLTKMTGTGK
jgi:hypothetical protein